MLRIAWSPLFALGCSCGRVGWCPGRVLVARLPHGATCRHQSKKIQRLFLSQRHEAQIPVRGTRLDDLLQLPAAACRPLRHNPIGRITVTVHSIAPDARFCSVALAREPGHDHSELSALSL